MKRNVLKRAIALIGIMAMLLTSAVTVSAYKDTAFPYSNDFEHWDVSSWNFWLLPSYDTGLGATAFGSDYTPAQIVADNDPAHNKVFFMERPENDSEERFIYWLLPEITDGKYVMEFDAKTTGAGMMFTGRQTDHTGSGETAIVQMAGNSITSGGNLISTYNSGEWKSFKILFDVETGDVTTFVDGESETINNSLFKTARAMYFAVNAGATMSLDNIKTFIVDENVKPTLTLEENNKPAGAFVAEESETLVLSLNDSEFGTLPQVTMSSSGADIMSTEDNVEVEIETRFSNGKVIIEDYYLDLGVRYEISVAEGTKDLFGRSVDTTPVSFIYDENDGWVVLKAMEEDFAVDSINTAVGAWFGSKGEFALFDGSPDAIQLVSDNSYSAGKAITVSKGARLEVAGLSFVPKKGRVRLEAKMDLGSGVEIGYYNNLYGPNRARIMYGQYFDLDSDGTEDKTINYHYTDAATNNLYDKWILSEGMDTISYKMNFGTSTTEVTHNGVDFELPLVTNDHLTGYGFDILDNFNRFSIIVNSEPVVIDYFKIYHEYNPVVVNSIKATDVTDDKVEVDSQITINFSKAVNADTLSNITVSNGEENVDYTGEWNADTNTYTLIFDKRLAPQTQYSVTVPNTVVDLEGYDSKSVYGTFTTAPLPPMDVENIAAVWSKASNSVSVSADVINPTDAIVSMVVAGYKGTVMETIEIIPVTILASTTNISESVTLTETDIDTVKAFALYDLSTIRPYCPAATATVQ